MLTDKKVLIVGAGLAGINLAWHLYDKGVSFQIIDAAKTNSSSRVAAGLINPITGKRAVLTWKATKIFPYMEKFYLGLEQRLDVKFYHPRPLLKPFRDTEEQNDVMAKTADRPFGEYIELVDKVSEYEGVLDQEYGVGILSGGNITTVSLLDASIKFFQSLSRYTKREVSDSEMVDNRIEGLDYDILVYAEGYKAMNNPNFSWLPFSVTLGEMLELKSNKIPTTHIINKGGFVLPISSDKFLLGSTYDLSTEAVVREKGRKKLIEKADSLLNVDYEVVGERAAVRPTVRDRRPFIGQHPENKQVYIFNGFGTKGASLSPFFANHFVDYLMGNEKLDKEVNIERYYSLYYKS